MFARLRTTQLTVHRSSWRCSLENLRKTRTPQSFLQLDPFCFSFHCRNGHEIFFFKIFFNFFTSSSHKFDFPAASFLPPLPEKPFCPLENCVFFSIIVPSESIIASFPAKTLHRPSDTAPVIKQLFIIPYRSSAVEGLVIVFNVCSLHKLYDLCWQIRWKFSVIRM
jgi:hypothetical protein